MSDEVNLACVGDIRVSETTLEGIRDDPTFLEPARQILARADVCFANLEAPLIDGGRPLYSTGVRLRSPRATGRMLRQLGVSVVTLANNHLMDFGPEGLCHTLAQLEADGIAHVGAGLDSQAARRPAILEVGGQRLAFLGACDDQGGGAGPGPGVSLLNGHHLVPAVRRLRQRVDHVVVGIHSGLEFVPCPEPYFLDLSRALIEAGASVVIGHHPHVPQGVVRHGRGLIACSLGDFLFDLARPPGDLTPHQECFNRLHPILEVRLGPLGVCDHRMHWLTRDPGMGRFRLAEPTEILDPEREFIELCRLVEDEIAFRATAEQIYRAELRETLYTVYTALYLLLRRGQLHTLGELAWWLPTLCRQPRLRFLLQGLRATGPAILRSRRRRRQA